MPDTRNSPRGATTRQRSNFPGLLRGPAIVLAVVAGCISLPACNTGQDGPSTELVDLGGDVTAKPQVTIRDYGMLDDGSPVKLATLTNGRGIELDVISYGGIITRLVVPDANGEPGDIVLGMDSLDDYVRSSPYFGAIIGRYGNRIANGRFELAGKAYQLDINDGQNHLHGGPKGFDKRIWNIEPLDATDVAGVRLSLTSEDGDQGYPGTLRTEVMYQLNGDNELVIQFSATTDAPTIVNLTHHSYFNLAGGGDILAHELMIPADQFTPIREGLIPTGEFRDVDGTPFDFRVAKAIRQDIEAENEQLRLGQGYDHNWVLKHETDAESWMAARLSDPVSGRVLEVWTDQPGVQFYSGNFLDGSLEGKGTVYEYRGGLCLEPQLFPDSPNQPSFPSATLLPGETYESRIIYRFLTAKPR